MTVCNACRYCEGYCPVFQAMEHRVTFAKGDLAYLANLCHDCGECLYACQYAPPHEFGINVPKTLGEIRVASYEEYCWPQFLSGAFRRQRLLTLLSFGAGLVTIVMAARMPLGRSYAGDFYQLVPHHVMVTLFTVVSMAVLTALGIGNARFRRADERGREGCSPVTRSPPRRAHASSPARQRHRLHARGGSSDPVAPLVPSLHVLRLRPVLRVDHGRRALSRGVRLASALRA